MNELAPLLERNRLWAEEMSARDPEFFLRLSRQQAPQYLWIGCSDSRVPATTIVGLAPGEVFVHRNVANLVKNDDANCLAVMQFAVDILKVRHVIVCGHYGCSGIQVALSGRRLGQSDPWLKEVRELAHAHRAGPGRGREASIHDELCELNVIEQVSNACRSFVVREAWRRGQELTVHGWIYGLEDGRLRDLGISVSREEDLLPLSDRASGRDLAGKASA
jgi:carbonic anhydrase